MWPAQRLMMANIPHTLPLHNAGNPESRGTFEAVAQWEVLRQTLYLLGLHSGMMVP